MNQDAAPTRHRTCWHRDLGLPALGTVRTKCCLSCTPVALCYLPELTVGMVLEPSQRISALPQTGRV